MNEILLPSQEQQILDKGLVYGDFVLRAGQYSSVKFEFDKIGKKSPEFSLIVSGLTTIIEELYPNAEAIITVGNGANKLAKPLRKELYLPSFKTKKHADKSFTMRSGPDQGMNAVLVDDVYTAGTSMGEVFDLAAQHNFFVLGGAVILDRSEPGNPARIYGKYGSVGRPVESLIKRQLPNNS